MIELTLHDPLLLAPARRRAQFIAHEQTLRRIVDAMRATPEDRVPQHRLITGPEGIGKTMLLARLGDELPPARYLNWATGLASLEHFLTELPEPGERALALVDGFDHVLDRIGDDAWRLRELLSTRTDLVLIGTAMRVPPGVLDYGSAFFDFFAIDALEPLENATRIRVLEHIASTCGVDVPRASAIASLVGGTPRALACAVEALLVQGKGIDPAQCLDHVCDRLAPQFLARLDSVSAQARIVLTELALHREPAHAKTIAQRLAWPTNKVSSYLVRLDDAHLVDKVELPPSKTAAFKLRDPLFARWFLPSADRANANAAG